MSVSCSARGDRITLSGKSSVQSLTDAKVVSKYRQSNRRIPEKYGAITGLFEIL
jgi:hypothetical protein